MVTRMRSRGVRSDRRHTSSTTTPLVPLIVPTLKVRA